MNAKIIFMISVVLLMFVVGTVNAGDVENLTDSDVLASIDEVDVSDDAEGLSDNEVLNSADDEDILGGISDNIQINYYDIVADNPHSVNIYNESDYVARIYAPTGSAGTVHLSIGESDDDADEIFNSSIQDLDKVIDENNPYYSYYYIRPAESVGPVDPGIYYVLVEYKVSSFTDYNYNYVHFVEDSRHVRVEDIYEIVIGGDNDHINIYVEGTRGYLRVLVDNVEVMHDSVFNLSYDEETDEFRYYIPVYMDDLSVGKHTYTVSYYGGNWDDVTISNEIDVTYLLEVYPEESEVYYGDNVTFSIFLPDDASSDEIKVNDVTYEIDVDYGVASLTLSDLEVGENVLVFTYDDVKYGEKSYTYELYVNPKLYIPETVRYASEDKIILKLPSDVLGKLNISIDKGGDWELIASKDVVNGEVNFTFDSSWDIGSYYILVEFEGENYDDMSDEGYIEIIPNVEMPKALYVDDEYNITIILPESTLDTLIVKIINGSDEQTIYNELSDGPVEITVPHLYVGDYELQVIYQKFNGEIITSTYPFDVRSQSPDWTIEAELEDFNIFSNDYAYGQIKNLPSDADGLLTLYIDGEKVDVFDSRYIQEFIKFDGYDFDLGTHSWEVKFDSDSYYKDSSASGTFEVLWIDVPDIVYPGIENHNSIVFLCNFEDISGYLSLKIDGEEYALEFVKNGTVIYLDDLEYGDHEYEIVLNEDKFGSLTKRGSFKVGYYFDVEVNGGNPVYAGIPFAVKVKTAKDATGNVTIDVGGKSYTKNIVNGSAEFDIGGLAIGNYTLAVNYLGNEVFPSQNITQNLTVNDYRITVGYINEESGIIKYVSLTLPSNANGNLVIYNQTGVMDTVPLENGSARYEFTNMEFGKNYSGYILYDGVDYDVERLDYNFNLNTIVDVNDTLVIGENATLSVDMFGIAGNITVYVNNVSLKNETLVNGKINVTIPSASMHLGNNIVTLRYEGSDLDYNPFDSDEYVIVVGPNELNIPDEFSDGAGNITLELPDGSSGNVTVYVNGELVSTKPVSGGKNNIPVNVSKAGDNTVKVCYTDDEGYSYEVTKTVNVPKPVPQVDIVTPSDSTVPIFTINLPEDAKGSLIVNIAGVNYVKDLVNGKATISVPGLADGVYDAIIKYSGDSKYAGFSKNTTVTIKTVPLKDPKLTIKVPSVYQANKPVITVTTDNTFTGKVLVTIKSKTYTVNVVKGKGTLSISRLGVGTYTAKAVFAGNIVFKSSIKSVNFKVKANVIKLTIKKVKIKKSAKKLIIKATLKINGKAVKGKKLKFKFNKKTYNAKTNKKGVAKITIKKKILKKLKVGKKVKYQVKYGKKTVKRTVKVRR